MRRGMALALCAVLAAQMVWAEAPASSLRPMSRPVAQVAEPMPPAQLAATGSVRPRARPARVAAVIVPSPEPLASEPAALVAVPRPRLRPVWPDPELASAPMPEPEPETKGKKREKTSKKGSVCGDPAIKGEALAPIRAKIKGCGLDKPVRVTSISGIRLNQPATISCETADAFKRWINKALLPAMGNREVVEIRIAASYVCRTRNNKKGAKISEHGRGKAVDVSGFIFADGREWSVARDYNKQIRKAHKGACGIFGTTLGPGSDGYHEDHLHFDIARHSNGAYCR